MTSPDKNPDARPLPEGWITQYDANYRTWFYVNTMAQPPLTTWEHPLGPPPPPPQQYAPPLNPPPPPAYGNTGSPYPPYPSPPSSAAYGPGPGSHYQGGSGAPMTYQKQPSYSGSSAFNEGNDKKAKKGGLIGSLLGGGKHSSSGLGGGIYPGQYHQKPPKKSGLGAGGGLALGAGAGLLGGLLVADAIDDIGDAGDFGGGDDFGDFGDF